jgi:hypothetical protein
MKLGKPGWLANVLAESATLYRPEAVRAAEQSRLACSKRGRARAFLRAELRERGLLYGTPDEGLSGATVDAEQSPEARLFLGILRTFARTALDIATLVEAPEGPRREQLLLLFAVLAGEQSAAKGLDALIRQRKPPSRRLWSTLEAALEQQADSLAGDPVHGLLLHNGAVVVAARLLGRQALDYFVRGGLRVPSASRRLNVGTRYMALLVEVLSALASADHRPHASSRRVILQQMEGLRLASAEEKALRARLERLFAGGTDLSSVLRGARGLDIRQWLLEQALLSAVALGYRSAAEREFLQRLAAALQFSFEQLTRLEAEVMAFYSAHRALVDAFTDTHAISSRGERVASLMQDKVVTTFHRLMQEVRETQELSILIGKVARGYSPSPEERARMRAQLIDLAKAVPALALFAAPGGLFLLMALAKVLPFSLLPSAFQDEPQVRRKP